MNDPIKPPEAGKASVRLGKAFLQNSKEKGLYELMRPVVTVQNDGEKTTTQSHPQPLGPLAIYRIKRGSDRAPTVEENMRQQALGGPPLEMRTSDPKTNQPLTLTLEWWPGKDVPTQ